MRGKVYSLLAHRLTADKKKGNQRFPQIAFGNFFYPQDVSEIAPYVLCKPQQYR